MSFDILAPHYRWMEWLLAGGKLQRCRTAFVAQVRHAHNVLLLGEGNGRFLTAFLQANHSATVTVVDASARMLNEAQRRAAASSDEGRDRRVHYVCADVLTWPPPRHTYDLIVTNFFLDCFSADQLAVIVPCLASATNASAQWVISDFRVPPCGLPRWRARLIIAVMYCFFRVVTRLPARTLTPVDSLLEASGFQLHARRLGEWGLLHTDLWRRTAVSDELGDARGSWMKTWSPRHDLMSSPVQITRRR